MKTTQRNAAKAKQTTISGHHAANDQLLQTVFVQKADLLKEIIYHIRIETYIEKTTTLRIMDSHSLLAERKIVSATNG